MIKITLSSANMGNVDETDFDLWARYVAEQIDERIGAPCEVDQFDFGAGAGEDRIVGASEEQRETIREFLSVSLWETFCGEVWEARRREHDANA